MAEPVYLSWNAPNWITVVLMVAIGMAVWGTIAAFIKVYVPGPSST